MKTIILGLVGVMLLTSCGLNSKAPRFDGQFYRTKLRKLDERHEFTVTATPVSASLLGAREAARFEATTYCVNEYGSSDIAWVVGPDDADEVLPIEGNTLTLQGACPL